MFAASYAVRDYRYMRGHADRLRAGIYSQPDCDARHDVLIAAGCDQVLIEKASGKGAGRPELDEALRSANQAGDRLVVTEARPAWAVLCPRVASGHRGAVSDVAQLRAELAPGLARALPAGGADRAHRRQPLRTCLWLSPPAVAGRDPVPRRPEPGPFPGKFAEAARPLAAAGLPLWHDIHHRHRRGDDVRPRPGRGGLGPGPGCQLMSSRNVREE